MSTKELIVSCISSLKETFSSNASSLEMKAKSLQSLTEIVNSQESRKIFHDLFYFETLSYLISTMNFETNEEMNDFFITIREIVLKGPSDQSFLLLIRSIKNCSYEEIKFHKLSFLLAQLLKNGCIAKYMTEVCSKITKDNYDSFQEEILLFIQNIVSSPSILANIYQRNPFLEEFNEENYFSTVSNDVFSVLENIKSRMTHNEDSSITPLSRLVGKVCLSGSGRIFWKSFMEKVTDEVISSFLWKKMMSQLVSKVEDYCFNACVESLVLELKQPRQLDFCFGDLSKNPRVEQVLLDKFILNRYYADTTPLKCIISYTASSPQNHAIFLRNFNKVLDSWSNKSFVKFRSFEHGFYINQAIMLCCSVLQKDRALAHRAKESVEKALLQGTPHYLGASLEEVRQMGMLVAVTLASLLPNEDNQLKLPYKECAVTRKLLSLLEDVDEEGVDEEEGVRKSRKGNEEVRWGDEKEDKERREGEGKEESKEGVEEELDSDDDLVPIHKLQKPRSKKVPHYLGECLEGLVSSEDAELAEECLKACEGLVERYKEVKALHKELCGVLLHLEDRFSIDDFEEMRMKAMLKLVVVSADVVAEFLSGEFYKRNYTLKQRCDILDVLVNGAQVLSSLKEEQLTNADASVNEAINSGGFDKYITKKPCPDYGENDSNEDWRKVVAKRIEKKTRRFARSQSATVEAANKLSPVVGWFFYPLMKHFDYSEEGINLLQSEHLLLEKLLMSLARILYHSHNTLPAGRMLKSLLQFTACFHRHEEVGVRRAVLACVWSCMYVLGGRVTLEDVLHELVHAEEWLQQMQSGECHQGNVELLDNLLPLLSSLKLKHLISVAY